MDPAQEVAPDCEVYDWIRFSMYTPQTSTPLPFAGSRVIKVDVGETDTLQAWNERGRAPIYIRRVKWEGDGYPWVYTAAIEIPQPGKVIAILSEDQAWIVDSSFNLAPYIQDREEDRLELEVRVYASGLKPAARQRIETWVELYLCADGWEAVQDAPADKLDGRPSQPDPGLPPNNIDIPGNNVNGGGEGGTDG